jgi:hypothetical protein
MPFRDRVGDFFAGSLPLDEIVELPTLPFEPETIKFELSINGKRRTIGMSDPADMRGEYDVTKDVKMGRDGNPRFESIDAIARELLADMNITMYGSSGASS